MTNPGESTLLKVAFGATALLSPLTGIGHYAMQLGRGLLAHSDVEPTFFHSWQFSDRIFTNAPASHGAGLRPLVRRFIPNAYGVDRLVRQRFLDRETKRRHFDVYHEPNYLALRFDGPTVITVHDLSWIRYPETHPVERVRAMDKYFEASLRRASLLLTDSHFVSREIVDVFGVDPAVIRTVPLGLDPLFRPMDAAATRSVLEPLELTHGSYLLCVGTLEPRKNIHATIAAYGQLPASLRARHPLVLAGMKGWRTSALEKLLDPLVRSGEVRMLGYLPREDLVAVTAGALTMVYPSIYEGFGLPPLEAMGCGVPPITSDASSLPEVVGDGGLMIGPKDIDGLAQLMKQMVEDTALRARLADAALRQAARFTWERCVEETLASYRIAAATR